MKKVGTSLKDCGALVRLAQAATEPLDGGDELLQTLRRHVGVPPRELPVVVEEFPAHRLADLDILLESVTHRDPNARLVGIGGGGQRNHMSLSDMMQHAQRYAAFPLAPPDVTNQPVGPDEQRQTVGLGLRLFRYDGAAVAVLQRAAKPTKACSRARSFRSKSVNTAPASAG